MIPNPYERTQDNNPKYYITGEIDSQAAADFLATYWGGTIFLNSRGGDISSMLAIFDHIKRFEETVIVATGVVQSAAAVLFQAAAVRVMTRNASLQFIPPPENRDLDKPRWDLHSMLVNLVRERTGMALPESYDLFDEEILNAERSLQLGLTDKIEGRPDDYVAPTSWTASTPLDDDRTWAGLSSDLTQSDLDSGSAGSTPEEPGDTDGNR